MQILIRAGEVQTSPAIVERVNQEVEHALRLFRERVTRVEVHLHDTNGQKSGVDKRCVIEARLAGQQPMAVEHAAADMYDAIHAAAGKLERAVRHKIERHDEHQRST